MKLNIFPEKTLKNPFQHDFINSGSLKRELEKGEQEIRTGHKFLQSGKNLSGIIFFLNTCHFPGLKNGAICFPRESLP